MTEPLVTSEPPSQPQADQYSIIAIAILLALSHMSTISSELGVGIQLSEPKFGPFQLLVLAVALWYGRSVIKEEVISQIYRPLIILTGFLSLFGLWRVPLGDLTQPYHLHSVLLALLANYAPSVFNEQFMGSRNKYMLLPLAILFISSSSWPSALFEPYLQWVVVAAGLFVALIFTNTNLVGTILWSFHDRKKLLDCIQVFPAGRVTEVPSWIRVPVLVLLFHPWTRSWFIPLILAAVWQYFRFHYRITSQSLLTRACSVAAKATSHASRLQSDAASLERLALQAHALGASISGDARAAHNIRLTDFYTESTHAWAKLGDFRQAIADTADKADQFFQFTNELRKNVERTTQDDGARQKARAVYEASKGIAREGHEFRRDAKQIQAKTERFKRTSEWADNSRNAQATAATAAASCAETITTKAATARQDARDAEDAAETLHEAVKFVENAIAAGNKPEAEKKVEEMEKTKLGSESTLRTEAEAEMQKLYAFTVPSPLPALVDDSDVEGQSDDGNDGD